MILKNLPVGSLPALRATCTQLKYPVSALLFERLWISPYKRDQARLFAVSVHPEYRKLVKEVAYDATYPMETPPDGALRDFTQPHYHWLGQKLPRDEHSIPPVSHMRKTTGASLKRGFYWNHEKRDQQRATRPFDADDLCRTHKLGRKLFRTFLHQPENYEQILHYLADDLAALVTSIRHLTNVRSLVISDRRYVSDSGRMRYNPVISPPFFMKHTDSWAKELTYRILNKDVPAKEALIIDPATFPDNRERYPQAFKHDHYRGFRVLMQAVSMLGLESVKSVKVERASVYSGLSYDILNMTERQLFHTKRAFRNLTTISLQLNTSYPTSRDYPPHLIQADGLEPWRDVLAKGHLAEALKEAYQLQVLSIIFDKPIAGKKDQRVRYLEKLVGVHTCVSFPRASTSLLRSRLEVEDIS